MPANVDELVVRVADICTYKWDVIRNRPFAYLASGFAGGAMVVFGATLALSVSAGVPDLAVGLANLLMGIVFMFSLVIIMVSGMTLVTADMYIGIIGVFHRRIGWGWFVWGVVLGYIGNFLGSMFFMWLISKSASYAYWPWLARAHAIGVAKMGQTAIEIFAMGIVCTWMLQTAAILYVKADGDTAKIAMAAYGPLAPQTTYRAYPEDAEDYYFFELTARTRVTIRVEQYAPTSSNGTLMLYGPSSGGSCGPRIDYYGPPGHASMSLGPHTLAPGRYSIRVYTAQGFSTRERYWLVVRGAP